MTGEATGGGYLVPAGRAEAELSDRGSRFLAVVQPAQDRAAAAAAVEELRRAHPGATHHCWAWRLGLPAAERSADDGEPAGTAGPPILGVLRGAGLSDVLAVVVRWFGGTKLGKGGLIRAYAGATRAALASLPLARRVVAVRLVAELSYDRLGAVKRLLRPPQVELAAEEYGARVRLHLAVHAECREELAESLRALGVELSEGA